MIEEMDSSFSTDFGFSRDLRNWYYTYVAALVDLWLYDFRDQLGRLHIYKTQTALSKDVPSSHEHCPSEEWVRLSIFLPSIIPR